MQKLPRSQERIRRCPVIQAPREPAFKELTRAELMAETVQRLMMEQLDQEQREHGWGS